MKKLIFVKDGKICDKYKQPLPNDPNVDNLGDEVVIKGWKIRYDRLMGTYYIVVSNNGDTDRFYNGFDSVGKAIRFVIKYSWEKETADPVKIDERTEEVYDCITNVDPDYIFVTRLTILFKNHKMGLAKSLRDNYSNFGRFNSVKLAAYLIANFKGNGGI